MFYQAGTQQYKSCFTFVAAVARFDDAQHWCQVTELMFMTFYNESDCCSAKIVICPTSVRTTRVRWTSPPGLNDNNVRTQPNCADTSCPMMYVHGYINPSVHGVQDVLALPHDTRVWVTGEHVQPGQCAYLSTRSRLIEVDNCQRLLPFVCEIGTECILLMYKHVQACSLTTSHCCIARPASHS
jgi:hypothetical protein